MSTLTVRGKDKELLEALCKIKGISKTRYLRELLNNHLNETRELIKGLQAIDAVPGSPYWTIHLPDWPEKGLWWEMEDLAKKLGRTRDDLATEIISDYLQVWEK